MKLHLSESEAHQLVLIIDEEEKGVDEEILQGIKAKILESPDPYRIRRSDLEMILDMVPLDWHEIHQFTNPHCTERTSKKGKVKPCLTCKLSQKRAEAASNLRKALGLPLPKGR